MATTAVVSGCDPCFGTAACADPHVSAEGRLIWHLDGSPASNVTVEFWPDEAATAADTLRAVTNGFGSFLLSGPPTRADRVPGTLVFYPPEPYTHWVFGVPDVWIETTRIRGDVRFLGNWGVGPIRTDPHVTYVGELQYSQTGERAGGVEVEFRRTGGIAVVPDTVTVVSGDDGRFLLVMKVVPAIDGEVIGELHIRPPPPFRAIIEEVRLRALFGLHDSRFLGVWSLEP